MAIASYDTSSQGVSVLYVGFLFFLKNYETMALRIFFENKNRIMLMGLFLFVSTLKHFLTIKTTASIPVLIPFFSMEI